VSWGLDLGTRPKHANSKQHRLTHSWLFPKPPFNKGTDVLLGLSASIVLFALLNMAYLGYENKKRARAGGFEGNAAPGDDGVPGDRSVHYRYIL
jgi:hypothetical protein